MVIDTKKYPYVMECEITVIKVNNKIETREVLHARFPLSESAVKEPWYVLTNHLAPAFVEKKLGRQGTTWQRIYERRIIEITNANNPNDVVDIPLRVMTIEQLQAFCVKKELVIDVKQFHTLELARRMVQLKLDDPTAYDMQYEQYISGEYRQKPEYDEYRKNADELVGAYDEVVGEAIGAPSKDTTPKPKHKSKPKQNTAANDVLSGV